MADTTTPKPPRKAAEPRGFTLELGTPADVADAGELGYLLGLKSKAQLEEEFQKYLESDGNRGAVPLFMVYLKGKVREKLDGMGPKPPASQTTPDGGIPIAGPKE